MDSASVSKNSQPPLNAQSSSTLIPPSELGILQPAGFPGLPTGWGCGYETFPSAKGDLKLFGLELRPEDKAWEKNRNAHRTLFVLHGLGEHGGRYLHFPHYVQEEVGSVYCLDLRGHGRSEGLRGHVDRFDDYTDDVVHAIRRLEASRRERFGRSEIHFFAHSMGGLISLRAGFLHHGLPVRAITASAPLLGIKVELPLFKRAAAHLLAHVWGSLHMESEVAPDRLTHDPAVSATYLKDRLIHHKGTPRLYIEIQRAIADTAARVEGMGFPLSLLIPEKDLIVDAEENVRFGKELKHRDKEIITYPGFFHESFNEVGKEKAFEDLRQWIRKHSA